MSSYSAAITSVFLQEECVDDTQNDVDWKKTKIKVETLVKSTRKHYRLQVRSQLRSASDCILKLYLLSFCCEHEQHIYILALSTELASGF
jgi:hypothetical protein